MPNLHIDTNKMIPDTSTVPHSAATVSALAATASVAGWMSDHAIFFTIAAAITAVLSGVAAMLFYSVSIYYKIKYEAKAAKTIVTVAATVEKA